MSCLGVDRVVASRARARPAGWEYVEIKGRLYAAPGLGSWYMVVSLCIGGGGNVARLPCVTIR